MVVQRKFIVTELERNNIRESYGLSPIYESEIIISNWLSPDEKYAIFLDELYDITNKVKIGNIWENFDNFKMFIKHSFEVAENVPTNIKESVLNSIKTLTESNQNLSGLKPYIKQMFITEGIGDWAVGASGWLKNQVKGAIDGTTDFFTTSLSGIQKMVKGITSGQWLEVINLIKSGALYVARKIRSALYTPIGLILDAILIASSVGKGFQFVIWGIIVALDIYELTTGKYENQNESFLERLLFTGVDMIGLVFAGVVAKSSKSFIGNVFKKFGTSQNGLAKAAQSNPKFKSILESILSSATGASGKMSQVSAFLKTKSPMLYKFVSNILGGINKFVMLIVNSIKGIFKLISKPGQSIKNALGGGRLGKGVAAGVNTTALVGAVGTYGQVKTNKQNKEISDALSKSEIKADFTNIDL